MPSRRWIVKSSLCDGATAPISKVECDISDRFCTCHTSVQCEHLFGPSQKDRAEQRLRMCIDGRGLGSNLVSFSKGFSKHPHFLAIIKVDSEYLRFSFKLKVDYFILY